MTFENLYETTNLVDVTLNLENCQHSPHSKLNDSLKYLNINSNDDTSTFDNVIKDISFRITDISVTEEISDNHATYYKQAIASSAFSQET